MLLWHGGVRGCVELSSVSFLCCLDPRARAKRFPTKHSASVEVASENETSLPKASPKKRVKGKKRPWPKDALVSYGLNLGWGGPIGDILEGIGGPMQGIYYKFNPGLM